MEALWREGTTRGHGAVWKDGGLFISLERLHLPPFAAHNTHRHETVGSSIPAGSKERLAAACVGVVTEPSSHPESENSEPSMLFHDGRPVMESVRSDKSGFLSGLRGGIVSSVPFCN
ncbi:hypothetical protein EYF80_022133 [Liparis tanakae]|uniref:Uncharacterized protein n=1 Tax=Liparis tanakae TaxID=230148 RepID=A0A4Z2HPA0_9TELE|nr:hypothetical protein EYF80_022133 [Liparis tanakae]